MMSDLAFLQTVEGAQRQIFPNLEELISKFEKPNQGLVVHLLRPIKRTCPSLRWRRSKIELDGIYGKKLSHGCQTGTLVPFPPLGYFAEPIQIISPFYDVSSKKLHPMKSTFHFVGKWCLQAPGGGKHIELSVLAQPGEEEWLLNILQELTSDSFCDLVQTTQVWE